MSSALELLWDKHLKGEFETKDVEATLATMVDDACGNHLPVNTGGRGQDALRALLIVNMNALRHRPPTSWPPGPVT